MSNPTLSIPEPDIDYPEQAQRTMPQTEWHRVLVGLLIDALIFVHRGVERIYVGGDMFLYYERGNRASVVAPDVFIVRGVERQRRRSWRVWNEGGRLPEFVIEILSEGTRGEDLGDKLALYRDTLRVAEYFAFDPEDTHVVPRLQGWRLEGRRYVPIEEVDGRLPSAVTGLHLEANGNELRLWNPATGAWVPTYPEREAAEAAARLAAEARVRELEAELARLGRTP